MTKDELKNIFKAAYDKSKTPAMLNKQFEEFLNTMISKAKLYKED